ncbi:hypothetical protein, partial [Streptomyces sp. NPDC057199]|uniref:hypothetical protein n=1 Tax=Streptomyces sp. NPDC057199 TaxID=3346047 RepID=UPI00362D6F72
APAADVVVDVLVGVEAVGVAARAAGRVVAMAAVRARTSTALVERRAGVPGEYEDDLMGRTSSDGFGSARVR